MQGARVLTCLLAVAFANGADRAFAAPTVSEFSYEDLVSLIRERGVRSVDETLPLLPEEFRSSYTLMHTTKSLQDASPAFPRAILFGRNAKLTCSFNGSPEQEGYDSFECFQFREAEHRFDFRQIQFPTRENGLENVVFSEENRSSDGRVACNSCHARDPRPNWDAYSRWPGAYGEFDDELRTPESKVREYTAFVRTRAQHPRYKWLIQSDFAEAPFSAARGIEWRPNLRFSEFVGRMNSLRATRILSASTTRSEALAFAVHAIGCADLRQQAATAFEKTGLRPFFWSTRIPSREPLVGEPWEHQAGFGYLSRGVALAIAKREANSGNSILERALREIANRLPSWQSGSDLLFMQEADKIALDIQRFSPRFEENKALICPELLSTYERESQASH